MPGKPKRSSEVFPINEAPVPVLVFGDRMLVYPDTAGRKSTVPAAIKAIHGGHFDFVHDDDKATYVNIGLSGGLGKFGLNIECPSKADASQKLTAYVWVNKDELDRNADVRVKWDDEPFKTEHWDVSSRALKPRQIVQFIKKLTTASRLTVEYLPVGTRTPNTIVLPVAGAGEQLHQYAQPGSEKHQTAAMLISG